MKRLKPKQLGPYCSYCQPRESRAIYRQDSWEGKYCCESHKDNLAEDELLSSIRDQRMTEADYQTWGSL